MELKLTGSNNSSGVTFKVPKDEVTTVVDAMMCRPGLRRITIDWDDLGVSELPKSIIPELDLPSKITDMIDTAIRDEILNRIDSAIIEHQHILKSPPLTVPLKIDTLENDDVVVTDANYSISVQQTTDATEDPEEPKSNITVNEPKLDTVPQPGITEPPTQPEPPATPPESQPVDITPFYEIGRVSFKELKEVKSTNNPRLTFYAMGDGRIVLDYANSKVYTTWVAIKNLPDKVPDEMQGTLNDQKWHAVKAFKAWMVWRKEQQTDP